MLGWFQPGQLTQEASMLQDLMQGAAFLDRSGKGKPSWRLRGGSVRLEGRTCGEKEALPCDLGRLGAPILWVNLQQG